MIAVLKLIAVLAIIVLLIRKARLHLGVVLLLASAATWILFLIPPLEFVSSVGKEIISAKSTTFLAIIALVVMLSRAMEAVGYFKRMVGGVASILPSRRMRLTVLPAIIGMLPMPGGAVFSAPLIERASEGLKLDIHRKAAMNFWFRHVWEFCWPLYPGVIIFGQELSKLNLSLSQVLPLQAILTPMMVLAGVIFLFPRNLGAKSVDAAVKPSGTKLADALVPAIPVLIVVACFIGLGPLSSVAAHSLGVKESSQVGRLIDMMPFIAGLVAAIAFVVLSSGGRWREVTKKMFAGPQLPSMIFMAFGIVIFGAVISSNRVAPLISDFFEQTGLMIPIIVLLPFLLGLVTGITIGYITIALPIIVLMVGGEANPLSHSYPYLMLAFASGFMGVMLSPAHLCLLVSREYFKADMLQMYRRLAGPVLFMALAATGLFFLLRWLL